MEKVKLTYKEIIKGAVGFGLISEKQASRKREKRLCWKRLASGYVTARALSDTTLGLIGFGECYCSSAE